MASGTHAAPAGLFVGYRMIVGATPVVAEFPSDFFPLRAVTSTGTRNGVGDLVEQHLVDLVVIGAGGKMPRDGDAALLMVALAKPGLRVVELEAPRAIEVEANQGVGPHPNPLLLRHGHRLARQLPGAGALSPASRQ